MLITEYFQLLNLEGIWKSLQRGRWDISCCKTTLSCEVVVFLLKSRISLNTRLRLTLETHSSASAKATVEMIHAELFDFIGDSPLVDDITILAVRRTGLESGSISKPKSAS